MLHQHVADGTGRRTLLAIVSLMILSGTEFAKLNSQAIVITNKMRYSTGDTQESRSLLPFSQMFEQMASSTTNHQNLYRTQKAKRRKFMPPSQQARLLLDDEDRILLDKFYRETKEGDPFLDDKMTIESLWKDSEANGASTLLDQQSPLEKQQPAHHSGDTTSTNNGWTFEPDYQNQQTAHYSPTMQLLTNYDPIVNSNKLATPTRGTGIVGATFYGQDKSVRPGVSSKLASDAVRLHNSMLRQPPRDGIVRVRMYHHRAIHDEPHLYGNGPWKYWGHGWGMEFGFDPNSLQKDKDFYQKGYTIERAFGRDFCDKRHRNCRPSDPQFFNDPLKAGKYSERDFVQHRPGYREA